MGREAAAVQAVLVQGEEADDDAHQRGDAGDDQRGEVHLRRARGAAAPGAVRGVQVHEFLHRVPSRAATRTRTRRGEEGGG